MAGQESNSAETTATYWLPVCLSDYLIIPGVHPLHCKKGFKILSSYRRILIFVLVKNIIKNDWIIIQPSTNYIRKQSFLRLYYYYLFENFSLQSKSRGFVLEPSALPFYLAIRHLNFIYDCFGMLHIFIRSMQHTKDNLHGRLQVISFSRNDHYLVFKITTVLDTSLEQVFSTYCYFNTYWPTERSVLVKPQSVIKSLFG